MRATSEGFVDHGIEAAVFDMDGVVTNTAEAHFEAWKKVFDRFLQKHAPEARAFTRRDYLDHVDGIPRYEGVRRFLGSRGIELPENGRDATEMDSVHSLGTLKNDQFRAWLNENQVPVFPDAIDLIACLRKVGITVGVFSASRNARAVLASAGVSNLFDAIVDGQETARLGLAPKPDPAQLTETARRVGVSPSRALVVEDAIAGVKAGAGGRFRFVIGVDRLRDAGDEQRFMLRANGADLVTDDLRGLILPNGDGLRTLDRLPLVWEREEALRSKISGRRLSVFLDYDGTLSPIVADYRKAFLLDGMADAISTLAQHDPIAIITGRDVQDVRARVGIESVIYAGSHGFDIAGPGGLKKRPDAAEDFLAPIDAAEAELRTGIAGIEGAAIERKLFSIAVHYRQVAQADVDRLTATVQRIVDRHADLRQSRGKKVLQIQPRANWDKGRAIRWLLDETELGKDRRLPLYIGDDLTDEDAFAALKPDGISIVVRGDDRPTLADFTLQDTADVRRFLGWLERLAQGK